MRGRACHAVAEGAAALGIGLRGPELERLLGRGPRPRAAGERFNDRGPRGHREPPEERATTDRFGIAPGGGEFGHQVSCQAANRDGVTRWRGAPVLAAGVMISVVLHGDKRRAHRRTDAVAREPSFATRPSPPAGARGRR